MAAGTESTADRNNSSHYGRATGAALNPHFDMKKVTALAATGKASRACTPFKNVMLKMCEQFEPQNLTSTRASSAMAVAGSRV
jgi:hypothetical protein